MLKNEAWRASAEGLEVLILNPGYDNRTWRLVNWKSGFNFRRINEGLIIIGSGSNGFVAIEDVAKSYSSN